MVKNRSMQMTFFCASRMCNEILGDLTRYICVRYLNLLRHLLRALTWLMRDGSKEKIVDGGIALYVQRGESRG